MPCLPGSLSHLSDDYDSKVLQLGVESLLAVFGRAEEMLDGEESASHIGIVD